MLKFDLNIDQVLENWEVYHACREIIANALDEQKISGTPDVSIVEYYQGVWQIRDYGRGISIEHFTQNENKEKLEHPNLIGRFGVGLKDALATFDRKGVQVKIESRNGIFTLERHPKADFNEIVTLHVNVMDNPDKDFQGTLVTLRGCEKSDMEAAKSLFIEFSDLDPLEKTGYGDIYPSQSDLSFIYINGVKVAEEGNFMFSYNITSLTAKIKKSINRERTNVGRSAYTDRIKSILLSAEKEEVLSKLADNMNEVDTFRLKDELKWTDVGVHAIRMLNLSRKYIFMSHYEMKEMSGNNRDMIRSSGKEVITVSDHVLNRLQDEYDEEGQPIATVDVFMEDYVLSFQYEFIDELKLSKNEKEIFSQKNKICTYFKMSPYSNKIKISESIRPTVYGDDVCGEYDKDQDIIIIRRDQLDSYQDFMGTLIHELIHAKTGFPDVNREFELALTDVIGTLSADLFKEKNIGKTNKSFKDIFNV